MKIKNEKFNIYKCKENKGITLIALVVTIIVLLILAGVSIAMIAGEGGILTNAREARDRTEVSDVIEMAQLDILNIQSANEGKIKESEFREVLDRYFTYELEDDIVPDDLSELTLTTKDGKNSGIKASEIYSGTLSDKKSNTVTAGDLASQVEGTDENGTGSIIGEKVTGLKTASTLEETYEWQIFDVDNDHIYLIATDYIHTNDCPDKGTDKILPNRTVYQNSMDNVINGYPNGSEDIAETMRSLNSSWFSQNYSSKNGNMKAVAYMLDTKIWTKEFTGSETGNNQVEYVVGGPSIEQIFKAYNKKYGTQYSAKAFSSIGYQMNQMPSDTDSDYSYYFSGLKKSDSTFIISNSIKAGAEWVASPAAERPEKVIGVGYNSDVRGHEYYSTYYAGFRPVVTLKSEVQLKETEDGYIIVE